MSIILYQVIDSRNEEILFQNEHKQRCLNYMDDIWGENSTDYIYTYLKEVKDEYNPGEKIDQPSNEPLTAGKIKKYFIDENVTDDVFINVYNKNGELTSNIDLWFENLETRKYVSLEGKKPFWKMKEEQKAEQIDATNIHRRNTHEKYLLSNLHRISDDVLAKIVEVIEDEAEIPSKKKRERQSEDWEIERKARETAAHKYIRLRNVYDGVKAHLPNGVDTVKFQNWQEAYAYVKEY